MELVVPNETKEKNFNKTETFFKTFQNIGMIQCHHNHKKRKR